MDKKGREPDDNRPRSSHITAVRDTDFLLDDELTRGMVDFVREMLDPVNSLSKSGRHFPFRNRYAHSLRVLGWVYRIASVEGGDIGVLTVASIFHDVGYCVVGEGHALRSADIFHSYYESEAFDTHIPVYKNAASGTAGITAAFGGSIGVAAAVRRTLADKDSVERTIQVIAEHSAKHLSNDVLPLESRILMDSDMLDEAGTMEIVADCFLESAALSYDYDSAYERLCESFEHSAKDQSRFHTDEGLRRHLDMRRCCEQFLTSLKTELTRT